MTLNDERGQFALATAGIKYSCQLLRNSVRGELKFRRTGALQLMANTETARLVICPRTLRSPRHQSPTAFVSLPDCLNHGGLKAAVAGDERKAEMESSRSDDTVRHIGNKASRNALQSGSDVGVERDDGECGIVSA